MKLKCIKTAGKMDCGVEYEAEHLTEGKSYQGFLVSSEVDFDNVKKEDINKHIFLIFNDNKQWRQYDSSLFIPFID